MSYIRVINHENHKVTFANSLHVCRGFWSKRRRTELGCSSDDELEYARAPLAKEGRPRANAAEARGTQRALVDSGATHFIINLDKAFFDNYEKTITIIETADG